MLAPPRLVELSAALLASLASATVGAQDLGAFVCSFPGGVFAPFEEGLWRPEPTSGMSLTFAAVDIARGTAQLVGNAGVADVQVLVGRDNLHLVETTGSGNLTITTIYAGSGGTLLPAVHSRHVGHSVTPMATQMHGTCEARERG